MKTVSVPVRRGQGRGYVQMEDVVVQTIDPTLPDLDRLLALCEAIPDTIGFESAMLRGAVHADAVELKRLIPALIAYLKIETARADKFERELYQAQDELSEEQEATEHAEAKLLKARGEVTEAAVEAACVRHRELIGAPFWEVIKKDEKLAQIMRSNMHAALTAALPHLVPDRGEMPEQSITDEDVENWSRLDIRNTEHPASVCMARDLLKLRRAWAKQQDASRDVRTEEAPLTKVLCQTIEQIYDVARAEFSALIDKPAPQQDAGGEAEAATETLRRAYGDDWARVLWEAANGSPLPPPPAQEPRR